MSRQHHDIKCETQFFQAVQANLKTFELRKNDRDYKVFDIVTLQESVKGIRTGREIRVEIKYILHGGVYGLRKGYCIFGFERWV